MRSYASVASKTVAMAPVLWTQETAIPPAYSSYQRPPTAMPLMPCAYCGSAALSVAPWEGAPYVWCVCGWAWPLEVAVAEDGWCEESDGITSRTTSTWESEDQTVVTQKNEQDLEAFLARANLPQLYAPLCRANMWLPGLRSIPLGLLHNDLLDLVPHRAYRQRLIDALHSTVDVRLSHKNKQGVWHRARDHGRTVYICGVSALTDLELRKYLGYHHGHVVDMRYMFDPRNDSFMGYGFVMFERKEAVDSILRNTSYAIREGVTLMVKCSDNIDRTGREIAEAGDCTIAVVVAHKFEAATDKKAVADKAAADKAAADKAAADKTVVDKAAANKAVADKAATDKAVADKKAAADKAAADKAAAVKAAADKAVAYKATSDKAAANKKAAADKAAANKKAAADKVAADKSAAEADKKLTAEKKSASDKKAAPKSKAAEDAEFNALLNQLAAVKPAHEGAFESWVKGLTRQGRAEIQGRRQADTRQQS